MQAGKRGLRGALLPTLVCAALAGASDRPAAASVRDGHGFFAVELVTADAARFVREWERPAAHVNLTTDSRIPRGGAATAFVIFKNCEPGPSGACHVTAKFIITGPTGRRVGPLPAVLWGRAPLGPEVFTRGVAAPTFSLGKGDPPGVYRMEAAVTDAEANETLTTSVPVTFD